MNSRAIANAVLCCFFKKRCSLNKAFSTVIPQKIHAKDLGFIKECCFGTLRWHHQLTHIKATLLNKPLKTKDDDIGSLITLGLYQLLYTQVPNHAAVSETVAACKLIKKPWACGLINKCLRRFLSEKNQIMAALKINDSVYYSHPPWLIDKIKAAWPQRWQHIVAENNQKPPQWLRINCQKTTITAYQEKLENAGIASHHSAAFPHGILIIKPLSTKDIPGFEAGESSIQDVSGQFAASLLDLAPGQQVLDACAAPGSKSSHLLETMPQLATLTLVDLDAKRLDKIKQNLDRLQLNHHHTQLLLADATKTGQWWDGKQFDRILLDAPCSATGVIRRHPDIKLLRKKQDIEALQQKQIQLLTALWPTLKKNGKLLYATCSLLPEENEEAVAHFLSLQKDAQPEKIDLSIGVHQRFGVQLLPEESGSDGFYYALLSKN
jgi:16S rRNA (cytosine967-C5)-methyltransferase